MFKVFMQGDKKYVTMHFYKKLFQSRLWHNGFLLVFTLIGYHNPDKSMRFDEGECLCKQKKKLVF